MLRLSLLAEGSSDAVLLAPIGWMLARDPVVDGYVLSRIDFGQVAKPPRTLKERIARAFEVDAPDILLVHRDADKAHLAVAREQEIVDAAAGFGARCVPVVPVLMSESWFLFDEAALRSAAGSTTRSTPLELPSIPNLEEERKPKQKLRISLRAASGPSGRRLRDFDCRAAYHRLSDRIDDFGPLLDVPSFARTADALREAVADAMKRKRDERTRTRDQGVRR